MFSIHITGIQELVIISLKHYQYSYNYCNVRAFITFVNVTEDMPTYISHDIKIFTFENDDDVINRHDMLDSMNEVYSNMVNSLKLLDGEFARVDVDESMHIMIDAIFSGENNEEDMKEDSDYNYSFIFESNFKNDYSVEVNRKLTINGSSDVSYKDTIIFIMIVLFQLNTFLITREPYHLQSLQRHMCDFSAADSA